MELRPPWPLPWPGAGAALSYRHPRSGEWAHDVRDPLAEAWWTYVLPAASLRLPAAAAPWRVLEIGFGRGLNTATALALLAGRGHRGQVEACGFEPRPEFLSPWPECPPPLCPWAPWWGHGVGAWVLPPATHVAVAASAAAAGLAGREAPFDWIFLDLFSPGRHPEDWEPELFLRLRRAAAPGAVLTSYCTARSLREGLTASGWAVERLLPAGRRASLRAVFPL